MNKKNFLKWLWITLPAVLLVWGLATLGSYLFNSWGSNTFVTQSFTWWDWSWSSSSSSSSSGDGSGVKYDCILTTWLVYWSWPVMSYECLPSANGPYTDPMCNNECGSVPMCGNGVLENWEQCDDGNVNNGDGCDNLCQIEGDPVWCTIDINLIKDNEYGEVSYTVNVPNGWNGSMSCVLKNWNVMMWYKDWLDGDFASLRMGKYNISCTGQPLSGSAIFCESDIFTILPNGPYCGDGICQPNEKDKFGNPICTLDCKGPIKPDDPKTNDWWDKGGRWWRF